MSPFSRLSTVLAAFSGVIPKLAAVTVGTTAMTISDAAVDAALSTPREAGQAQQPGADQSRRFSLSLDETCLLRDSKRFPCGSRHYWCR